MSQLTTSVRRGAGDLDVFTVLLGVAALVLLVGVLALVRANIDHSASPSGGDGGPFTLVS